MLTVDVHFPDGIRAVPARARTKRFNPIGKPAIEVDAGNEPLAMEGWTFRQSLDGKWTAMSTR